MVDLVVLNNPAAIAANLTKYGLASGEQLNANQIKAILYNVSVNPQSSQLLQEILKVPIDPNGPNANALTGLQNTTPATIQNPGSCSCNKEGENIGVYNTGLGIIGILICCVLLLKLIHLIRTL